MNRSHIVTAKEIAKLAVFEGKEIRKTIHNGEWWFVVEDVVLALIDSKDPKQYIQRMKQRDPELGKGWVQIVHTLAIYIVDFVSFDKKLVIELDGSQHAAHAGYDTRRDACLKANGFRVLRFWNSEVMENIEGVVEIIRRQYC